MSDQSSKPTKITVTNKGYIQVTGDFALVDKKGVTIQKQKSKVNLCGCGLSTDWPICDDSHSKWKKPWKKKGKKKEK